MKNWMKLAIAAAVGLVAAFLNNVALQSKMTPREYIRIRPTVKVRAGVPLTDGDLEKLLLPASELDDLAKTAVPWKDKSAMVGIPASRELKGGSILFWRDAAPAAESLLEPGEAAVPVPIVGVRYPPGLLAIGRKVMFLVRKDRRSGGAPPPPATSGVPAIPAGAAPDIAQYDGLGPFRIIGVGDRLLNPKGDAGGNVSGGGDSLTLAMKMEGGKLDEQSLRLIASLRGGGPYGTVDALVVLQTDKKD